jgi:hypothetical protein
MSRGTIVTRFTGLQISLFSFDIPLILSDLRINSWFIAHVINFAIK